jgi:hypothetical protein
MELPSRYSNLYQLTWVLQRPHQRIEVQKINSVGLSIQ